VTESYRYLLDTNIVSDLINNGRRSAVAGMLDRHGALICTSIIVAGEIRYGVAKKGSRALAERADAILKALPFCPFGEPVDHHYGEIRVELERRGTPIGPNDLLIAAQCRALDLCLITANVGEFSRVPGLRIENWLGSTEATRALSAEVEAGSAKESASQQRARARADRSTIRKAPETRPSARSGIAGTNRGSVSRGTAGRPAAPWERARSS
jgi:tRNA(fMet)-specific endonuclease VapC